jgi:hypothetical protein
MPEKKINPDFYAASSEAAQNSNIRPVDSSLVLQLKSTVFEKVSGLIGYKNYLNQARSLKAVRKSVPNSFELEVQSNAGRAFSNAQALTTAALNLTNHLKQAGDLERRFDQLLAGVKAAGEVKAEDVLNDLEAYNVKDILAKNGVPDEVWSTMNDNAKKINGRLFIHEGQLAIEGKGSDQKQKRVVYTYKEPEQPNTTSELLNQGKFERIAGNFDQYNDGLSLSVVSGKSQTQDIYEAVLANAVHTSQLYAFHKRKLEDIGLSTQVGNDPGLITVLLVLAITMWVASVVIGIGCDVTNSNDEACKVSKLLMTLGLLLLFILIFRGEKVMPCPAGSGPDCQPIVYHVDQN